MLGSVLLSPPHNSNGKTTAPWLHWPSERRRGRKPGRRPGLATGALTPGFGATGHPVGAEGCVPTRSSSFSRALDLPAK